MWLECRFMDTEVDGSNPGISMLCPCASHITRIASVDSAVPDGVNLVKGIQCFELYRGIAFKNHAFFLFKAALQIHSTILIRMSNIS